MRQFVEPMNRPTESSQIQPRAKAQKLGVSRLRKSRGVRETCGVVSKGIERGLCANLPFALSYKSPIRVAPQSASKSCQLNIKPMFSTGNSQAVSTLAKTRWIKVRQGSSEHDPK